MAVVQDLVNAGYVGYTGWGEAEALADFKATGGSGKTGGGGSAGGGSSNNNGTVSPEYKPVTMEEFSKLEEQAFQLSKPYYIQLAKESRGDLTRARQVLEEDYIRNTRDAKEKYAIEKDNEDRSLQQSLGTLGLDFVQEQEKGINDLNKRGMAVGQNTVEGAYNVLQESPIVADPNNFTSSITNPANPDMMGRGGVELNRIFQDQKLRQEAVQRVTQKNLNELGLNYKNYTNPPEGDVSAPGADRSKFGTAELSKVRGIEDITRQQQITERDLFNQRRGEAFNTASQVASLQGREVPTALANRYLQAAQTDFTNLGYTG